VKILMPLAVLAATFGILLTDLAGRGFGYL
jgi:hypothetical protein